MARHAMVTGHIPFEVQVTAGLIPGWTSVAFVGHDATAAQANAILAPGNATGIINPVPLLETAATVSVASTDDTKDIAAGVGANTVEIQGLDANGDEQSVTVTLHASSGQTAVATTETWIAINHIHVKTVGSELDNSGTIWVGTGAFTAGVPAVGLFSIEPGENEGLTGTYTVPAGHSLYLQTVEASGDGAAAFKGIDFEVHVVSKALGLHLELFDVHLGDGGTLEMHPPFPVCTELQQLQFLGGSIAQTVSCTMRAAGFLRKTAQPHGWGG